MKLASDRITINPENPRARWGTSLQGYVQATFSQLCEVLGEPAPYECGDGKVLAEWLLQDEETDVVATVYCYKETEIPLASYRWHIGGFNQKAVNLIRAVLPNNEVWSW